MQTTRRRERGGTATEYAIVAGVIAVGVIGGVFALQRKVNATLNTVPTMAATAPASASSGTSPAVPAYTIKL